MWEDFWFFVARESVMTSAALQHDGCYVWLSHVLSYFLGNSNIVTFSVSCGEKANIFFADFHKMPGGCIMNKHIKATWGETFLWLLLVRVALKMRAHATLSMSAYLLQAELLLLVLLPLINFPRPLMLLQNDPGSFICSLVRPQAAVELTENRKLT